MDVDRLDHVVLTVADIGFTCAFYEAVRGVEHRATKGHHGSQTINLHERGREFEPKALRPTPGSADLWFLTDLPIPVVMVHLARCEVPMEAGPFEREGAVGPTLSVHLRDPDGNLIEITDPAARRTGGA